MKPTSYLIIVLIFAGFALSQQRTSDWKEYTFPTDGFAITLPKEPTAHSEAGLSDTTVYSAPIGSNAKVSLHVVHKDLDCAATISQLKDDARAGKGDIDSASVKDVTLGKYQGVGYDWKMSSDLDGYELTYCTHSRIYAFSAGWPRSNPRPAALARVLKSFRLLSP